MRSEEGKGLALVAAGHRFDVILCDLQMPEVDGAALVRRLGVMAPELTRRVVFISGGAYTSETRGFIETVPNLVLEKPVRPEVLMASVDAALDARAALATEGGATRRRRHGWRVLMRCWKSQVQSAGSAKALRHSVSACPTPA